MGFIWKTENIENVLLWIPASSDEALFEKMFHKRFILILMENKSYSDLNGLCSPPPKMFKLGSPIISWLSLIVYQLLLQEVDWCSDSELNPQWRVFKFLWNFNFVKNSKFFSLLEIVWRDLEILFGYHSRLFYGSVWYFHVLF